MNTRAICSLCSLLCDSEELLMTCSRRKSLCELQKPLLTRSDAPVGRDHAIRIAHKWLAEANNIHIAGRISSVETTRAALSLAQAYNASIDGSSSPKADRSYQTLARNGAYLTTLSETRSIAECIVVIGSDRLLELQPQLPRILYRDPALQNQERFWSAPPSRSPRTGTVEPTGAPLILLMGTFSKEFIAQWTDLFRDVIAVPCNPQDAPKALLDWLDTHRSDESPSTEARCNSTFDEGQHAMRWRAKLQRLRVAPYMSVVWSHEDLAFDGLDYWLEELTRFLAALNESKRAGMVQLASLNNTCRQVATWTTGFPSSIRFEKGMPELDMATGSTESWLRSFSDDEHSLLLSIDENPSDGTDSPLSSGALSNFRGRWIRLSCSESPIPCSEASRLCSLTIALPGYDSDAEMNRSDGVILARVQAEVQSERIPASHILRKWLS